MNTKFLAILAALTCAAEAAFAQTATITATPNAFTLNPGQTFNVTFALQSGPTSVSGFDLFLESNSANVNNNFSITSETLAHPGTAAGVPTYPDVISTTTSDHAGFAQNANDQGANFNADAAVPTNLTMLTLQVGSLTPGGTYTFFTTGSAGPEDKQTLIFGGANDNFTQYSVTPTSFTVTVVPEPATWSLILTGGVGAAGLMLRRKRA